MNSSILYKLSKRIHEKKFGLKPDSKGRQLNPGLKSGQLIMCYLWTFTIRLYLQKWFSF